MIMHLKFYDGSNPYVALLKSGTWIKKEYRRWTRNHKQPLEEMAQIDVWSSAVDGLYVHSVWNGFALVYRDPKGLAKTFVRTYQKFGNAVNMMGKLSERIQKGEWK